MIEVKIKKLNGVQTHGQVFATQGEVDAWISEIKPTGAWGRLAYTETLQDGTTVDHPDQFTIQQTNVTQQYQLSEALQSLKSARSFGNNLVDTFAIENVILGINDSRSDQILAILFPALSALSNGYLETAIRRVKEIDSSNFDGVFLNEGRLLGYVNKIEAFLGLSLSTSL